MARTTVMQDDLSGEPGAKERRFSIESTNYEIDLTDENWQFFLEQIAPWRNASRVLAKRRNKAPVLSPDDRDKIRKWAEANNQHVAPRGRFPSSIVLAYYEQLNRST